MLSIEVTGNDLSELNKESGGHRVQRIPPTERRGRVHSSTVTIAIIDPKEIANVEFNERDFRIEWFSGSGAGGQHRNKTQNCCRLIHIPTGLMATAQCRSRENSFNDAKTALLDRIRKMQSTKIYAEESSLRKQQVGSGQRGDKMRTYRFQDDAVKDHHTGNSASCVKVLAGNFDLLW